MLIVQGVKVYPSAVADVVSAFRARVTGNIEIQADGPGTIVESPVCIRVEHEGEQDLDALRAELEQDIRQKLVFQAAVELVSKGTLAP